MPIQTNASVEHQQIPESETDALESFYLRTDIARLEQLITSSRAELDELRRELRERMANPSVRAVAIQIEDECDADD